MALLSGVDCIFVGCGRNFWGVEELKPVWWPNRIKFQNISKTNVTKNAIIDILILYMEYSNIPLVATNEHTSKKVVNNSIKSNNITSTPKRACTHSLVVAPTEIKQRLTENYIDEIIPTSENSFFEGLPFVPQVNQEKLPLSPDVIDITDVGASE